MDLRKSLKIENALNHTKGLKKANHKKKKSSIVETTEAESTPIVENTIVESQTIQTEELSAEPVNA